MKKSVFITATGTDVGKTYVTALIIKKMRENNLNTGYYKAALSGAEKINDEWVAGDAKYVCDISGLPYNMKDMVSYVYKTAVSPHLAAILEGNPVDLNVIEADFNSAKVKYDYLCVEGSGGIICPLRMDEIQTIMLENVIKTLNLSVIIVALPELGTINSTVLTVEYLRSRGIEIEGIILNNYDKNNFMHVDNKKQIEILSKIPVIACVKKFDLELDISVKKLKSIFKEVS